MPTLHYSVILISLFLFLNGCTAPEVSYLEPPVEPEHVLETMELAAGFEIELFASEPLITDPVAMEVDEYGRIYVLEMPGYPLDTEGSGRIKLLSDTNGDGYPDRAEVFADGLILPKGIMRWREGVLVADAPDILYLADTTGDGKADLKEVVLTGFARSNPQHNVNKPLYGLDNWIYLPNRGTIRTETYADRFGDTGSEVRFANRPESPVLPINAAGQNVRFRPESGQLELLSSSSQFGHDFDAWGRHFLISNAHHIYVEAIAARYLERNPDLIVRSAVHYAPLHGNAAEVYPVTDNPEHQLLTDIGVMTSASGLIYYLGGAFGEAYDDVAFVAESVHNLVHADRVREKGSVFEAERLIEGAEFLASRDSWFRPVNFYIGPDGALYVLDYYRHIIEHPQWMDDHALETLDLYAGIDRGRIYRIMPTGSSAPDWINNIRLGDAVSSELAALLNENNIWWRKHAQRLLVDRQDLSAAEPLERLARDGSAEARVHALWTLEGMQALGADLIRAGLADTHAGVRENAVRLAEKHLRQHPGLLSDLLKLERDPSPRVRYQLLLTLGFMDEPEVRQLRERLLFRDIEDSWVQIAALSAPSATTSDLLTNAVTELTANQTPGRRNYFRLIGSLIAAGEDQSSKVELIEKTAVDYQPETAWWQSATLDGFADQFQGETVDPSMLAETRDALLTLFFEASDDGMRRASLRILETTGLPDGAAGESMLERAEMIAGDQQAEAERRADAIGLIGLTEEPATYRQVLLSLIHTAEPVPVQRAALRILTRIPGDDIGARLLDQWNEMTPEVRSHAVDVLMTSESRVTMLLDAVENNRVLVSTIGWGRRVTLMRDWGGDVRDRARALLSEDPEARREVIEEYREVLTSSGDRERGREVYAQHCAPCHQIGEERGVAFGPDLATVRHWTPHSLLTKILDPGRAIADGYELWLVQRLSGGTVSGVLASETGGSITLRSAGGVETTIPRSDIESITSSNVSAMPEGLEHQIDRQEMADLIEYIRRGGN